MNTIIKLARDFALKAHGNQLYGIDKPYIYHLDQVVEILEPYGEMTHIVGYLHDVIEDTTIQLSNIIKEFGFTIATCVYILTDEPGKTREEKKNETYKKIMCFSTFSYIHIPLIVKAADRLANVLNKSKIDMYRKEHELFKKVYFKSGLCDEIWIKLDNILEIK